MDENKKNAKFEQKNLADEDFLQSLEWQEFQKAVGKKTFRIENESFVSSIIQHILPIVGKYFYIPRGPVIKIPNSNPSTGGQFPNKSQNWEKIKLEIRNLVDLAKKEDAGWIRIDPDSDEFLEYIKKNIPEKIVRAPHDMQPKEIFVIDITKDPEALLSQMKPKTRYNIGVAKKKHVVIKSPGQEVTSGEKKAYLEDFLKLTKEMALRNGITAHSEDYYRKMIASFPDGMLEIYVAEYEKKIIAANLVLFYGKQAVYLHGASGNAHRNAMAPFLLQWQAILDAKERGCQSYDFGGVQTPGVKHQKHSDLVGVTNFKLGFSPHTKPIEFPGSYDIIINPRKYAVYRGLQKAKSFAVRFRR